VESLLSFLSLSTVDPDSLKLSDAFMTALNKALAHQTDAEKATALKGLFNKYGHVFALRVTLGGLLVMTKTTILSGTKESKQTEDEVKASISAVVNGIGASSSVATGTKVSEMEENKKGFSSDTYNVKGGDTTLATSVDKWISTVGPCMYHFHLIYPNFSRRLTIPRQIRIGE
jgi:hypothetical protein